MAHDHKMKQIGEPLRNTHAREQAAYEAAKTADILGPIKAFGASRAVARGDAAPSQFAGLHIINDDGSTTPLGSGSTPGGIIGNAIVNSVNHHKTSISPEENERRYGAGAHEHIQNGDFPLQLPTGNGGQGIMWLDELK